MSLSTILWFVLFVVGALGQDWSHTANGTVKFNEAFNFTLPAKNLKTSANLTLNTTVGVLVCIQERFPIPAGPQFSNNTCTYFWNVTTGISTHHFNLRNLEHNVGVYFADEAVTSDNTTTVSTLFSGNTCGNNLYYSERDQMCQHAEDIEAVNGTFPVKLRNDTYTYFFVVNVPSQFGSLTLQRPAGLEEVSSMRIRFAGNPTKDIFDVSDSSSRTLTFNYPRPGPWIIAYVLHELGGKNESLELSVEDCSKTHGSGPGCKTTFTDAANDKDAMNITLLPHEEHYFRFESNIHSPLYVSLTTLDNKNLPNMYVSLGNLPSKANADIQNCNQANCDKVRSVYVNLTQSSTWFVRVVYEGETNTTFGLWWNTTCAPECTTDSRGTCRDGVCGCQIDYTGIDCSLAKGGLPAQYIVLIIIASLVFASAIIGFVAWAYMRRKRNNYELVS